MIGIYNVHKSPAQIFLIHRILLEMYLDKNNAIPQVLIMYRKYEVPDSRDCPVSPIPGIRLGGGQTISLRGHMLT